MTNNILETLQEVITQRVKNEIHNICNKLNINQISVKFELDFCNTPTFEESDICFYTNTMVKVSTQKNCKVFICTNNDQSVNKFSYCADWMRFFLLDDFKPRVFLFKKNNRKFTDIFFRKNDGSHSYNQISLSEIGKSIFSSDLIFNHFIIEKSSEKLLDSNLISYLEHYGKIVKVDELPEESQFKRWLKLSYQHHLITRNGVQEFLSILELLCMLSASERVSE